jgi:thymidylate kinase
VTRAAHDCETAPPPQPTIGSDSTADDGDRCAWGTPVRLCVTGTDGVGKSTLLAEVADRLARSGRRVAVVTVWDALRALPGVPPVATRDEIDRYFATLEPISRALLVFHALATALERARARGVQIELLDGYWYKCVATEIAYGGDAERLLRLAMVFPEPTHVVRLHLDVALAARRKTSFSRYETGFAGAPTARAFVVFQRRVAVALASVLAARPHLVLDARPPVSQLAARVVTNLDAALQSAGA